MKKIQCVGIDLGTSNCAMALTTDQGIETFEIPQIDGPNRFVGQRTLASALFLSVEGQFAPETIQLPWSQGNYRRICGNYARELSNQMPDRLVTSAKSWLCNATIDPFSHILPWNAGSSSEKLSPFEATCEYLRHLFQAFEYICEAKNCIADLSCTEVVITVPASFDEAARKLTSLAAKKAGWGDQSILLEEPQAAFYAWLDTVGTEWRQQIHKGDLVLVCDVGGGTTDFSLIAVSEIDGNLDLQRISVGEHILLGGDNMDLSLAFRLSNQLQKESIEIDEWQFYTVIESCRKAKEKLFQSPELDSLPIAIPSRGSNLFAQSITTHLRRSLLEEVVIDGFLPLTKITDLPEKDPDIGLKEFGLTYAADAAISKHLAEFLTRSLAILNNNPSLITIKQEQQSRQNLPFACPSAVLFNGGVFRSAQLRNQLMNLIKSWAPDQEIRELVGSDLDLAVGRGASKYGYIKLSGKGVRIRAGISRSYYIGLQATRPAIPGYKPPVKAVCVANQGMEEGEIVTLEGREFGLVTGTTVYFRFFSSTKRPEDTVGTIVLHAERELEETRKLEMYLPEIDPALKGTSVPVKLITSLSELGTLQLWMQHTRSEKRWDLSFSVRAE